MCAEYYCEDCCDFPVGSAAGVASSVGHVAVCGLCGFIYFFVNEGL